MGQEHALREFRTDALAGSLEVPLVLLYADEFPTGSDAGDCHCPASRVWIADSAAYRYFRLLDTPLHQRDWFLTWMQALIAIFLTRTTYTFPEFAVDSRRAQLIVPCHFYVTKRVPRFHSVQFIPHEPPSTR